MENKTITPASFHQTVKGWFTAQAISPDGEVVAERRGKNLILNDGMDMIGVTYYTALMAYASAGTGSRPNSISGGDSTITQSASIITLWPGATGLQNFSSSITSSTPFEVYYSASMSSGDVIVYGNGSQSMVVAIDTVNGMSASLSQSYDIPSGSNQTFTIWKTSQRALQKQTSRTSTYLSGFNGSTDETGSNGAPNIRTHYRTYDFTAETSTKNYTEVGVGWVASGTGSVFSRHVLPEMLAISSSYRLRLRYDLQVVYEPDIITPLTASVTGWPVAPATNTHASQSIQAFLASFIQSDGSQQTYLDCLSPGAYTDHTSTYFLFENFISTDSQSLRALGTSAARGGAQLATSHWRTTYVTNSYVAEKNAQWDLNDGNSQGIACIGFGNYYTGIGGNTPYATNKNAFLMLFEQTQSKLNTQVLTVVWRWTWDRGSFVD